MVREAEGKVAPNDQQKQGKKEEQHLGTKQQRDQMKKNKKISLFFLFSPCTSSLRTTQVLSVKGERKGAERRPKKKEKAAS